MKNKILSLFLMLLAPACAMADLPFRNHRYDVFKVLAVENDNIVFLGNSITNMHEWWEAFGNPKILNRGNSGAVTDEMVANLESVLAGRPAKIFFMMGTNDIGTQGMNTPAYVAANVRRTLRRCKEESPATQVYVQSILPSTLGLRTLEGELGANDSIRRLCTEYGATYIDLWDKFTGIPSGKYTLDGVHLTAEGYRIWCNAIAPYVGSDCVYPASASDNACGLGGVHGERCTYFGFAPVAKDDILFIGDGTVNGGEWHELLHSAHVKTRASGWGVPGSDISTMQAMLPNIFKGNAANEAPSQVYIQLGFSEAYGKTAAATVAAKYKTFVEKVRAYAPAAPIYICAVYPSPDASVNSAYIEPLNEQLKTLAEGMENVTFVADTYTKMVKNGVADTDLFTGVYLYGKGYARWSQILAPLMGGDTRATTDEEADARLTAFAARTALATALTTAENVEVGDAVGQIATQHAGGIATAVKEAYALLASAAATAEDMQAKATELSEAVKAALPYITLPTASEDGADVWYQLYTPQRGSRYLMSSGAGAGLTGSESGAGQTAAMWKFVKRTDGDTYDIINAADGSYVSPAASYNKQLSTTAARPASGWTLSYSETPGLFIICSGKVQINQTNLNNAVYNWSDNESGLDRKDNGCQYRIVETTLPEPDPDAFVKGDLEVSLSTGSYDNPTGVFNKTWRSTSSNPQLTFTCPANNMGKSGTDIVLYAGTAGSATYTLAVPAGYVITGYRFDYANIAGNTSAITFSGGGVTGTSSTETKHFAVEGLSSQSVSFTQKGDNKGVLVTSFVVSVENPQLVGVRCVSASGAATGRSKGVYDLSGKRLAKLPARGVYIVDGKKTVR